MNPKQARFVDEYLTDSNATQAAKRAGYSERTAYSHGQRLLKHVEIAAAIEIGRSAIAVRNALTQDEVIAGLRKEANLYTEDASHGARVSAWAKLGEHLGMFKQVLETKDTTLADLMREAEKFDRDSAG